MKGFVKLFLGLFLMSLLLTGCGLMKSNNQSPNQQGVQQGQQDSTAPAASSPSFQPFSFNIPDKSLTQNLAIVGKVDPSYRVFINEKEYPVDGSGNVNVQFTLAIGNNPIGIRVISSDGNSVYTTTKNVEYAPKPKLMLQTFQILGNSLIVTGTTDPNSIVEVKGDKAQADGTGNFTITTTFNGGNLVTILSTNGAGKTSVIEKKIISTTDQQAQNSISNSTSNTTSTSTTTSTTQ